MYLFFNIVNLSRELKMYNIHLRTEWIDGQEKAMY